MNLKDALPFVGMVSVQFMMVGKIVGVKEATSSGMTKFTYVFYSNAVASLILLPTSFLVHISLRCKFFLLALLGFIVEPTGNAAAQITPTTFTSAVFNLVPGFTFILAVVFRLEEVDFRSSSSVAKSIGTLGTIVGALIATLCNGPTILMSQTSHSNLVSNLHQLLMPDSNLLIGGLLLLIVCLASSAIVIIQVFLLKKFGAELIIVFFFCFFISIMSGIFSLVAERDLSAWSLQPTVRWLSVLYASKQSMIMWCLHKRGPLFITVFNPLGIVIAAVVDIIFLGDSLFLGSLVGSVVIVIGFYSVMWGKAKEVRKVIKDNMGVISSLESTSEAAPLLQNNSLEV